MKLFISFSGRKGGNCDEIASFSATKDDKIVFFRDLHIHACSDCAYTCFDGVCKYRADDIYDLYAQMLHCNQIIWLVPMYCGNPSALYFIWNERGQDFFAHNDVYDAIVEKLYIIGIYGKKESAPDFIPCLEKWFERTSLKNRVMGMERHRYGQKLHDRILDIPEEKSRIRTFLDGTDGI